MKVGNRLRESIRKEYGFTVRNMKRIPTVKNTSVFRLQTDQGNYILKSLYTSKTRQLFIIDAENYLRNQGISIPEVIPTLRNKPYFYWKHHLFILQRMYPGKPFGLRSPNRIKQAGSLLGKMHRASLGFRSELGDRYVGPSNWMKEYEDDLSSIRAWQKRNRYKKEPKIKVILPYIRFFLSSGKTARTMLHKNQFFLKWRNLPTHEHFLCHGDFHPRNFLINGSDTTIIDWEDVRYDSPSKDIIRLVDNIIDRDSKWSKKKFTMLLSEYLKENPLTDQQKSIFFIDLAFPHVFERYLRKKIYHRMSPYQVKQFLRREKQKTSDMLQSAREYQIT
ncbi:CotS family spore coat protein [Brevibacillus sp. NRS-1366]|uniref:CotS family spore coat protein n=1 Tax=Brevibacillus sp. NRS-1366 TaxID=3233899 RepID=UPI003D243693